MFQQRGVTGQGPILSKKLWGFFPAFRTVAHDDNSYSSMPVLSFVVCELREWLKIAPETGAKFLRFSVFSLWRYTYSCSINNLWVFSAGFMTGKLRVVWKKFVSQSKPTGSARIEHRDSRYLMECKKLWSPFNSTL